ncbi:hypothetical protein E4634_09980 [Mangrovimicrobium sediminis]|uniref:Uncharacterized protein n=1 Tax=Mangrovimicrobium sediminis TaxID=2562682 RepID=A0A4Z0M1P2_9GAMM|nr:hypothetical protein [Haliea sp. SAOS-164]TGD73354.1 hypothetical protein E4634_09980 [Haliea sp. SAOS-164]
MLGQLFAMGVDIATLPARLTWRSARAVSMTPAQLQQFSRELRAASDEAAREVRALLDEVDAEMSARAGHLSPEQKMQAASLALNAAEQHLSMAAVNLLRAFWLGSRAAREDAAAGYRAGRTRAGDTIIEHDPDVAVPRRADRDTP